MAGRQTESEQEAVSLFASLPPVRFGPPAKRRLRFGENKLRVSAVAHVAELADAPDLGSGTVRCEGSSPFVRTIFNGLPDGGVGLRKRPDDFSREISLVHFFNTSVQKNGSL